MAWYDTQRHPRPVRRHTGPARLPARPSAAGLDAEQLQEHETVGAGVTEIRVSDADDIARLMYVAKFRETGARHASDVAQP